MNLLKSNQFLLITFSRSKIMMILFVSFFSERSLGDIKSNDLDRIPKGTYT